MPGQRVSVCAGLWVPHQIPIQAAKTNGQLSPGERGGGEGGGMGVGDITPVVSQEVARILNGAVLVTCCLQVSTGTVYTVQYAQ